MERLLFLVAHALPFFHKEISSRLRLLAWGRALKRDERDFFSKSEENNSKQEKKKVDEEKRETDATESSRDRGEEEEEENKEKRKKKSVSFSSSAWSLFRKREDKEEEEIETKKESLGRGAEETGEGQSSLHHGSRREDDSRKPGDLFLYLAGLFLLQQIWSYFSELDRTLHRDLERKQMMKNKEHTSVNAAGADLSRLPGDKKDFFERKGDIEERMADSSCHRERHWRWKGAVVGDKEGRRRFSSPPPYEQIWSVQTLAESLVTAFNFHFCR